MKNKILIILLALAVLSSNIYAEEKDPNKLLSGIILTVAGGLVAYSGFRLDDVSMPAMRMEAGSFTWNKAGSSPWDVNSSGTVKNTGNLDLENITVSVEYKDFEGTLILAQTVNLDNKSASFGAGETDTFSSALTGLTAEPFFVSARFHGDYNALLETSSPDTALVGCGVAAAGIFLICDYIFDLTDFFEKKDVEVQLSMADNGFNLMTSKSF